MSFVQYPVVSKFLLISKNFSMLTSSWLFLYSFPAVSIVRRLSCFPCDSFHLTLRLGGLPPAVLCSIKRRDRAAAAAYCGLGRTHVVHIFSNVTFSICLKAVLTRINKFCFFHTRRIKIEILKKESVSFIGSNLL